MAVIVGFREGPVGVMVGFREGPVDGECSADGISMMVTGYEEDVTFKSASSGRKCTVTTSPPAERELATVSLISIQRVVV